MSGDCCYLFYEFKWERDSGEVMEQQFIFGLEEQQAMDCLNWEE